MFVREGEAVVELTLAANTEDTWVFDPAINFDGKRFVVVWSAGTRGAGERLFYSAIDVGTATAAARVDPQEYEQKSKVVTAQGPSTGIAYLAGAEGQPTTLRVRFLSKRRL